jgi:predicted phosphate transport protein (TIGR00153 family)
MSESNSIVTKLVNQVFPVMPDFYGLMSQQCDILVQTMEVFVEYMEDGSEEKAARVRQLEKEGDELKGRNVDILNRAFATPMDREDIYRAIITLDMVINYAKTTTRELEALSVKPDKYMREIAEEYLNGARALQQGFRRLTESPAEADEDGRAARKAERNVEKIYRRALAELFDVSDMVAMLESNEEGAEPKAMLKVVDMFKLREVYRHLSNGADRLAEAADRLHDIIVKIS